MVLALYILMVVLQLLDGYTTEEVLRFGGVEENPALAAFFAKYGTIGSLLALKIGVLFFIGYQTFHNHVFDTDVTLLVVLNVIYVGVVIHNFQVLRQQKTYANRQA